LFHFLYFNSFFHLSHFCGLYHVHHYGRETTGTLSRCKYSGSQPNRVPIAQSQHSKKTLCSWISENKE
jgi:hypothetical protein